MLRSTHLLLMEELQGGSPRERASLFCALHSNPSCKIRPHITGYPNYGVWSRSNPMYFLRPVRAVSSHLLQSIQKKTSSASQSPDNSLSRVCVQLADGRYVMQASLMQPLDQKRIQTHRIRSLVWLEQAMPQDLLPPVRELCFIRSGA